MTVLVALPATVASRPADDSSLDAGELAARVLAARVLASARMPCEGYVNGRGRT